MSTIGPLIGPCMPLRPERAANYGAILPREPSTPHRWSLMKWSLLAHRITPCTPSPPLRAKSSGATPRVVVSSPLRQLPTSLSMLAHKMAPCMHSPVTSSGTTPRLEVCHRGQDLLVASHCRRGALYRLDRPYSLRPCGEYRSKTVELHH